MRLASLTLLTLMTSTSLTWAQSAAEEAFDTIIKDYNSTGFMNAEVGSYEYDENSDTLTAKDLKVTLSFRWDEKNNPFAALSPKLGGAQITIQSSPDKPTKNEDGSKASEKQDKFLALDLTYTAPSVSYKGLAADDDKGYRFESMSINNANMISTTTTDDPDHSQTTNISLKGSQLITNGYVPFMGTFEADPAKPISSLLNYIRPMILETKADTITLPVQEITHSIKNNKNFQTETYGPAVINTIADGKISSVLLDYQKASVSLLYPDNTAGDRPIMTYNMEDIRYQGLDIAAMWALFDPGMPDFEGSKSVMKSSQSGKLTMDWDNDFQLSVGSFQQKDFDVQRPKTFLITEIEALIAKNKDKDKPAPEDMEKLFDAYFDLLSSLSLGHMEAGPIQAKKLDKDLDADIPHQIDISRFLVSEINNKGIKEFSFSGLSMLSDKLKQASLGKVALTNLEFPPYSALKTLAKASMEGQEPSPEQIAKASPPRWEVTLSDLAYEGTSGDKVNANDIHLAVRTKGLAIPAHVDLTTNELAISRSLISHPLAQTLMAQLNLGELKLNQKLSLNWNEQESTYKIEPLLIDLENIAKLEGMIGFGGILKDYLANPQRAEQAMATASILPAELSLKDQGGLAPLINLAGIMTGMSPEQLQTVGPAQVQAILAAYTKPEFATHVSTQIGSFLKDPKSLKIILAPTTPVPVAQILGIIAAAPQSLPDILKIDVSANTL